MLMMMMAKEFCSQSANRSDELTVQPLTAPKIGLEITNQSYNGIRIIKRIRLIISLFPLLYRYLFRYLYLYCFRFRFRFLNL